MSFRAPLHIAPVFYFQRNIELDAENLGLNVKVLINGNSCLCVSFKSQGDMNLYKLSGNYKESAKIKFYLKEDLE